MNKLIAIISITLALFVLGCKKNSPGINASPCTTTEPFKAVISVNEMIEGTQRMVPVDTIVNFQAVLKANTNSKGNNVSYEWRISSNGNTGTQYTQAAFELRFGPEWIGKKIDARLIARQGGVPACVSDDNVDTVYKSFYIYTNNKADTLLHRPYIVENTIKGNWRGGYTDEINRQFTVTVADFGFSPTTDSVIYYGVRLFNMPEGCGSRPSWASNPCTFAILPSSYSHPIEYGSRSFTANQPFTNDCNCTAVSLYGYIPYGQRDSLVVDISFYKPGTGTVEKTRQWRGQRL